MPIYEYRCEDCGHRFTLLTSWTKRDDALCTSCGSSKVTRLINSFSCGHNNQSSSCNTSGARKFG